MILKEEEEEVLQDVRTEVGEMKDFVCLSHS